MNKKELIEKIKLQLSSLLSSENVMEQKFAEQKSGDRLIVTPDENFGIGSEVFLRDGEGNNVPLLDGEYTFDDGIKIVVVAGKITAMVEPDAEVETETEVNLEDDKPKEDGDVIEELKSKIKMIEEKVDEMAKKFGEVKMENENLKHEFSKIASEPSTTKIEPAVVEFKSVEDKTNSIGSIDIMAIREKARKNR